MLRLRAAAAASLAGFTRAGATLGGLTPLARRSPLGALRSLTVRALAPPRIDGGKLPAGRKEAPLLLATGAIILATLLQQPLAPAACTGKRKNNPATVVASDIYEVERIVARRTARGAVQYLIAWKGYEDQTWEPLENLAGIEQDLAAFEANQKKENAEHAAQLADKQAAGALAKAAKKAMPNTPAGSSTSDVASSSGDTPSSANKSDSMFCGKKKAPVWLRFKEDPAKQGYYICQEVEDLETMKICGTCIGAKTWPSPLWNHFQGKHKRAYIESNGSLNPDLVDAFFAMPLAPSTWNLPVFAPATSSLDDLEKYLELPAISNMDLDLLAWWKARYHKLPEDLASGRPEGLPTLAKMARQHLGRPASSAGVERMFSKAGRLHDALKTLHARFF